MPDKKTLPLLDISTDGNIIISPEPDEKRKKRFTEALGGANRKHGKMLKRLA